MAGRFRMQPLGGPDRHDPWFRIGTLDIGSSAVMALLAVVGMIALSIVGSSFYTLAVEASAVLRGHLWQLVTWPIPNYPGLFEAISIAMLWYFGLQLERTVGRFRMAFFLVAMTFVLGLLAVIVQLFLFGSGIAIVGVGIISFMVFLTFIAEHPHARFFFNIPAWAIGAVFLGISLLSYIASRDVVGLAVFVFGMALVALLAKSIGLLAEVDWLPTLKLPHHQRAQRHPSTAGRAPRRSPRRRPKQDSGRTVLKGPWAASVEKDQAEFDALLDKISATGMASLTPAEVKRLHALRDRLRGQ